VNNPDRRPVLRGEVPGGNQRIRWSIVHRLRWGQVRECYRTNCWSVVHGPPMCSRFYSLVSCPYSCPHNCMTYRFSVGSGLFGNLCLLWIDKARVKTRPIYECRYDERLQTKDEESTRLTYTGFLGKIFWFENKNRWETPRFVEVIVSFLSLFLGLLD
jgi:hypothetical protein